MLINVDPLEQSPYLDSYFDMRDLLKRHIYGRSIAALDQGDLDRDAINSVEELEARRSRMREAFINSIGGLPPMDTPLNVRKCGEIVCDGFKIEKIIFESRPKTYVTANVYVPDGITSPRGAVLFLCGHHAASKAAGEYQTVCRIFVKAGLVVMAQDPVGQGERFSYWEPALGHPTIDGGTSDHDQAGLQSLPLGDSIIRYFVHDAMRAVDYLASRPDVNPNKIGVTGNSGGGTQTCLMMICDPRIAAAAPCTFVMNRKSLLLNGSPMDQEQVWPETTALGFDHEDVMMMMAPKPVRVLAVTWDFFPIEAARRTVQRCKRFWEMCGNPGGIDIVEDECLHAYSRPLARSAAEFFSSSFGQDFSLRRDDAETEPMDESKTWCTKSGQVRGEIAGARFIYDDNEDRLAQFEAERAALSEDQRRQRAVAWLREKAFAFREPCDLNPRFLYDDTLQDLRVRNACWFSQEGMVNYGHMFRRIQDDVKKLPITVAVWDDGCSDLLPHMKWIRETCESGRAVMVLNVSGVGKLAPHPIRNCPVLEFYGMIFKLTDDLFCLGDSLVAMRVYDVIRSVDMIEQWPGIDAGDIRFYGAGLHSIYPRLAGMLDKRIGDVELAPGAFRSWADWVRSRHYEHRDALSVILPGALKYFDLPDADRWRAVDTGSKLS